MRRHPLGVLLAIALILVLAGQIHRSTRPPTLGERLEALRPELMALKDSVARCQRLLTAREGVFRGYDSRLDSLRARIEAFESLHPDGVPADSYPAYLRTFEEYNAQVPGWSDRADSLELRWARCRALIEAHNALADSVRELLGQLPT